MCERERMCVYLVTNRYGRELIRCVGVECGVVRVLDEVVVAGTCCCESEHDTTTHYT